MNQIGVNAREESQSKKRNKEIEVLIQHVTALFKKSFPNPKNIPSQHAFESGWKLFLSSCDKTIGTKKNYRLAFNHAVHILKKYKDNYDWPYSPPSYLVSHKEPQQLRTKSWLNQAWAVNDFYHHWFNNLLHNSTSQLAKEIYRNLLLSLAFHSGHCFDKVILTFHHQLTSDSLILHRWSKHVFCALELTTTQLNTNCRINGEKKTIQTCYLHPITLGLLRLWLKCNKNGWMPPSEKKLCHFLKGEEKQSKNFPNTLKSFCQAAIYTTEHFDNVELSQALVEYRIGKIKSYGIAPDNLARVNQPTVNILNHFEFYVTATNASRQQNNLAAAFKPTCDQHFFTKFKACFYQDKTQTKKLTSNTIRFELNTLLTQHKWSLGEIILLKWFIHKSHSCASSTLKQYHASLTRRWLHLGQDCDFSQIDAESLEHIYETTIDKIEKKHSQEYFAKRLKDLHSFSVFKGYLPEISVHYFHQDITQRHTRAGFIDEALFLALLNHVDQLSDLNNDEKGCLKSLCLISYRCGLRLSELMKLQLKNIELSDIGWINIRDNKYGSNKTASSLRKVPLYPLLLEHEADIIKQHLSQKKLLNKAPASLAFSFGQNPYQPFDTFQVSAFVGNTLKALSGLQHFVFHHLRHSCFSRLQLIFELDNQELSNIPNLCPYSIQQMESIQKVIKGRSLQNGYFAIAALAGHESPEMTFSYYFHFSDLISYLKIKRSEFTLTSKQKTMIGMTTKYQIKDPKHNHLDYLINKLNVMVLLSTVENGVTVNHIHQTVSNNSLTLCYRVLEEYQKGISLKEITHQYHIKQKDLDKWLANAHFIKSLQTNTAIPQSRHFTKAREHLLLPAKLPSNTENQLINKLIVKLRSEYKNNKTILSDMLAYALNNTSVSKSGIYFNDPKKLKIFIETFSFMIPKSSWRAITLYHQNSIVLNEWESALKSIRKRQGKKSKSKSKLAQGAVRLEFISPNEEKLKKQYGYKKYSTHALLYLFHMMGIMMLKNNSMPKNTQQQKTNTIINPPRIRNALVRLV